MKCQNCHQATVTRAREVDGKGMLLCQWCAADFDELGALPDVVVTGMGMMRVPKKPKPEDKT